MHGGTRSMTGTPGPVLQPSQVMFASWRCARRTNCGPIQHLCVSHTLRLDTKLCDYDSRAALQPTRDIRPLFVALCSETTSNSRRIKHKWQIIKQKKNWSGLFM